MPRDDRIKIAMSYDDWVKVSRAVADTGTADDDGHLLALAARLERELGHPAVSGSLEAASQRVFAKSN